MNPRQVKAAFITGEHPYDSVALWDCLNNIDGIAWYPQTVGNFAVNIAERRQEYDAVVFYNFNQTAPGGREDWWEAGQREALESLGNNATGIVLLHHAILAYPDWDHWSEMVGIDNRRFDYRPEATFDVDIADPSHPITVGLRPYRFTDETYLMDSAEAGSHLLLTTNSNENMHSLAWTRTFRKARVFCYQSGHGAPALSQPVFRQVLGAGINWCAQGPTTPDRG